jgi:2'-5' RNA ligase
VKLAVVAYPRLRVADRAWIESIRAQHDPQAGLIAAHVTLVFPADHIEAGELANFLRGCLHGEGTIDIVLTKITLVEETGSAYCFIEPEQGADRLIALYDRLHRGPLAAHRAVNKVFRPHITIARSPDPRPCQKLCDGLGRIRIAGTIDALDLVSVNADNVSSIEQFRLKSAGDSAGRTP